MTNKVATVFSRVLSAIKDQDSILYDAEMNGEMVFKDTFVQDNKSKVIIIYGDNASGKSLFAQLFEASLRSPKDKSKKIPVRAAAMRNRTMSGMEKAIIFGDENDQSTGETSVSVAEKCLRCTYNEPCAVAILDEPDVGLADRFQDAFGMHIASEAKKFKDHGLILISHSRLLINAFLKYYEQPVSLLGICTTLNYEEWAADRPNATLEELLNLSDYAHEKYRAIMKALHPR